MLSRRISAEIAACCREAGLPVEAIELAPSQRDDLGQFQINAAMALAKTLRRPPRAIAEQIVGSLGAIRYLRDVRVDGPGFVNLSLTPEFLANELDGLAADPRQGVLLPEGAAERLVLDFGGPNLAKAMHVGHLRSAIIGDTLRRMASFLGHCVTADVHLGDWGLPMGMVLGELLEREPGLATLSPAAIASEWQAPSIDDLNEIYPAAAGKCRADEAEAARARKLTADLQDGEERLTAIWRRIVGASIAAAKRDFDRLNVTFDLWYGESRVHRRLSALIDSVRASGLAELSDGALVLRLPDASGAETIPPLILEKSDGGVVYAGTDLATVADRVETLAPDAIVYVVDQRQHLHFEQVFRAARLLGLVTADRPALEHVGFGTINGLDGKPLKTRAGGVVRLSDLLDQVAAVCRERFAESGLGESLPSDAQNVAIERLAVAVVRFADLSNNRRSDYIFNVERFSALEGRTGPYLCYVVSRASAVIRKATEAGFVAGAINALPTAAEQALALRLLLFPDAVEDAFAKRQPHLLCEDLFELGRSFNTFYHETHILSEPDSVRRASMLGLMAAVARQMRTGLGLLGIEPPDVM